MPVGLGLGLSFLFSPFAPFPAHPRLALTVSTPQALTRPAPQSDPLDSLPIKGSVLVTFLFLKLHNGRGALSAEPRGDRMTAVLLGQLLSLPSRTCPLYTPPHVPPNPALVPPGTSGILVTRHLGRTNSPLDVVVYGFYGALWSLSSLTSVSRPSYANSALVPFFARSILEKNRRHRLYFLFTLLSR